MVLAPLEPAPRPYLHHCYADHHNVRDILLVVNFSAYRCGESAGVRLPPAPSLAVVLQTTGA